jgi:hypothetical protein
MVKILYGFAVTYVKELGRSISGKKKRDKRFVENFRRTEMAKYISIRYNPDLVMSATPMDRDSSLTFINQHPIKLDFLENATQLELKMWVRSRYKRWINK